MRKYGLLFMLTLIVGSAVISLGGLALAARTDEKDLPKTIGLTEVQRLKDENYQLKVNALQTQINLIQAERSEMLKGALQVAGVTGADVEKYQYDQQKYIFTLQEKAAVKALPTPTSKGK